MSYNDKSTNEKQKTSYPAYLVRPTHIYDVPELTKTLKKSTATINGAIQRGDLPTIDDRKPFLIHGQEAYDFCERQNRTRKVTVAPGEFYCFSCRASRCAEPGSIWLDNSKAPKRVFIRGKCAVCGKDLFCVSTPRVAEEKLALAIKRSKRVQKLSACNSRVVEKTTEREVLYNVINARIIYDYLRYLRHARGFSEKAMRTVESDILRYQRFTEFATFGVFDADMAIAYKEWLQDRERNLSPYTIKNSLSKLRDFLTWLREKRGFKRKISTESISYLNVTRKDEMAMRQPRLKTYPTMEQIAAAIYAMPCDTPKERRNRVMVLLVAMTGIRIGSLPFLRVKHLDLQEKILVQEPDEIPTKNGLYVVSNLIYLDVKLLEILREYISELTTVHLFGPEDPLFPKLQLKVCDKYQNFTEGEFSKGFMRDEQMARRICKAAFANSGFEGFSPHRIRHGLCAFIKTVAKTPEETMAAARSIGHTSDRHLRDTYGKMSYERQIEVMRRLVPPPEEPAHV
jgi:integrase